MLGDIDFDRIKGTDLDAVLDAVKPLALDATLLLRGQDQRVHDIDYQTPGLSEMIAHARQRGNLLRLGFQHGQHVERNDHGVETPFDPKRGDVASDHTDGAVVLESLNGARKHSFATVDAQDPGSCVEEGTYEPAGPHAENENVTIGHFDERSVQRGIRRKTGMLEIVETSNGIVWVQLATIMNSILDDGRVRIGRAMAQLLVGKTTVASEPSRGDILIVDDEDDIVTFLAAVLSDEGFPLRTARNGREALHAIKTKLPALVILDLMMPEINGMEVLETLRNGFVEECPAVLVLSAKSSHKDILEALEKGACDFIPKPFDLDDLLLRVRVWMDRANTGEPAVTTVRIYTLAPFRIVLGDELLFDDHFGDSASRLIVKYLVTKPNQQVDKEDLLYLISPDRDRTVARDKLDQRIAELRNVLRADLPAHHFLVEQGSTISFDMSQDVWCDATEFESQVRLGQQAQEAGESDAALGTFLSALSLYNEDYLRENFYDDWPSERRERLREMWMSALFRSGAITADRCEFSDSIRFMKRVLDVDPYRENAYQALMLYLTRAGRRSEAIQLYRYAERLFAQHLAAQPAPSTRILYEKILKGEAG